jgi:hypothetical protein
MTTTIALFTSIRNPKTGKRESVTVLPETIEYFNADNLIVAYYIKSDDKYVTIPGTEFHHVADKWYAQFAL